VPTTPQYTPKEYKPGDRPDSSDFNMRGRELMRLARIGIAGGGVQSGGAGNILTLPSGIGFVYGKITGVGTGANDNAHSWTQQRNIGDGAFEAEDNPIIGDTAASPLKNPAYELTGQIADNDTVVQLWPGRPIISGSDYIQPWFFSLGGGGNGGTTVALIRVSSKTEDANGYQPGFVRTFNTATHAYADSGSEIKVRNPNRTAESPEKLSLRVYQGIKDESQVGGVDLYHVVIGALCVDGVLIR
jgi:hypothetical protein